MKAVGVGTGLALGGATLELTGTEPASALSTGVVLDSFEDGDLAEYEYGPDQNDPVEIVSAPTYHGDRALMMDGLTEFNSFSGLDYYPSPGDTVSCHIRGANGVAIGNFAYGVQDHDNQYVAQLRWDNQTAKLLRVEDGELHGIDVQDAALDYDVWYDYEVEWGEDGTHAATVTDDSGTEVVELSGTDTTYTSGGIGYDSYANDAWGGGEVYFDYVLLEEQPLDADVQLIDDFEDDDLSEYEYDPDRNGPAQVVSSPTYNGDGALMMDETTEVISRSGLDYYPSDGDTFGCHVRGENGVTIANFTYGVQDHQNRYLVQLRWDNQSVKLVRYEDDDLNVIDHVNPTLDHGVWYEIEVEWGDDGSHVATVTDDAGNQVAAVSATDTTWSSGGVGFDGYAGDAWGGGEVYFDYATAEQQVSSAVSSAYDADARQQRVAEANDRRTQAADFFTSDVEFVEHPTNGDEAFDGRIASFSKGLPHDDLGEVDLAVYNDLVDFVEGGSPGSFGDDDVEGDDGNNGFTAGGERVLVNPEGAWSYNVQGLDPHDIYLAPPPAFDGEETAAEMIELYWHALCRDVRFRNFDSDATVQDAISELQDYADSIDFGPTDANGNVTADTVFRADFPGVKTGPYVSQFLLQEIPRGVKRKANTFRPFAETDYVTDFATWVDVQNGVIPDTLAPSRKSERYPTTGRDLASYVRENPSHQPYTVAALIMENAGVPFDPGNPFDERTELGPFDAFIDYGSRDYQSAIPGVLQESFHAAWYHKWQVHRRLRPETFGGRLEVHRNDDATYPIDQALLDSTALSRTETQQGNALLSQTYPEGSPTHPSYPAGHATTAGACATLLKAYFDHTANVPDPKRVSETDPTQLVDASESLTVEGEVNKLATNVSVGRDWAGVHYRSDSVEGMRLGERFAINWLADRLRMKAVGGSLTVPTFDGSTVTIESETAPDPTVLIDGSTGPYRPDP